MEHRDRQLSRLSENLARLLSECDYPGVRSRLLEYSSSEWFTPKYASLQIERILPHEELAGLAVEVATISIERNTPEALERFHPGMGTPIKVAELHKDLHIQRAWARWRLGDAEGARGDLETALQYHGRFARPSCHGAVILSAADLIRIGIVSATTEAEYGWANVRQGIGVDSSALEADPTYRTEVSELVRRRFGSSVTLEAVVEDILADHILPAAGLANLDGVPVDWASDDRPTMIVFFSPLCGSCQQLLRSVGPLRAELVEAGRLVLILNQPDLVDHALPLLLELGHPKDDVAVLTTGSAYDHIVGEPTTWIVDRSGTAVYRRVGFRPGDEHRFREELNAARRT